MAFRKQAALALALTSVVLFFGCTDQLNAPVTDETPVAPPTNVSAFALSDGNVRVKWDASSDPTINGYNVYRRDVGSGGGAKKLNSTRILATEYLDNGTGVPKEYQYRVTAVNSKGKESHWTAVTIFTQTLTDPGTNKYPIPQN